MDKDVLEVVLKKNCKDITIEKILSVEVSPAVAENLNFLSIVNRLKLKVLLGNGRVCTKSLIVKVGKEFSDFNNEFNSKYETFKTETLMYNTYLKQIEYLMEEYEDTDDVLWCKMVHHVPYKIVVLEDLKAMGFHMMDREKFFELDHILLGMHCLGRYHGMFKALEQRGLAPQKLKPWFIFDNFNMQQYIYWDLMALLDGIKRLWDPSWRPIVERVTLTKKELQERLNKFTELDETKFNVTNHGDCNKNNIVFKYNWDKRPIALRFLDYQLVHYGSPCVDLTYMIYLGTKPTVRRDNFDLILSTYHKALISTLEKYEYNGIKPELEEIREGMDKYFFLGSLMCLAWYPHLMTSDKMYENRDFEKILATDGKEGYTDGIFQLESFEDNIGPDVKAFVDKFYPDIK